jgi:hypothetical protein
MGDDRAPARPTSAKRFDVRVPEGPSVARPFENGDGPSMAEAGSMVVSSAFFTAVEPCDGRSHGARQPDLSIRETASRPVID